MRKKRFGEAAELLRSEIAQQSDPMARLTSLDELAMILELDGQVPESLAVMQERIELAPDEPIGWCILAKWHARNGTESSDGGSSKTSKALETIDHAIDVAERTGGAWLRHCLNDRARIATAIGRWDVVENTIRRILAIPNGRGVADTAVETDFLAKLPAGAVDADLIQHLREQHAAASERRKLREN